MAQISVIGAGSWGTALAVLLQSNGHDVTIWSFKQSEVDMLNEYRENKLKLPGVHIDESILITADMEEAVRNREVVVLAVPSPFIRNTSRIMSSYVAPGQVIVNVAKGIEDDTLKTLSEQIEEEIPQADVAVLSGPSHAEEVGIRKPTAVVVGAHTAGTAEYIQDLFMNDVFRVYVSPDILGIELGGSIKNVIALAAGIADGLGCGDNTKAALITRGLKEITALGSAMGAQKETLMGLTGLGDLIVTCSSIHSRNRKAGYLMGQGRSMEEAMEEVQMVVEGVYSAKAAGKLAEKYRVSLPIIETVNKILFEKLDPACALRALMLRDKVIEDSNLSW